MEIVTGTITCANDDIHKILPGLDYDVFFWIWIQLIDFTLSNKASKNRVQSDIEPIKFYPTGTEILSKNAKFNKKVADVVNSKLKIKLPIFEKGQEIKNSTAFPPFSK